MTVLYKADMRSARYTPEGGIERCAYCRFFSAPSGCGRIIGLVSPRGWCRYFSQQFSYLRDPGGIPTGGSAGPSLDLTFTTMSTLDPSVTFARASTATYFNSAGTMQTAASGAARFDYDPVTHLARGLLIEEARTNIIVNSPGQAAWAISGTTRTLNQGTAPDGTATMTRFTETATTAPHYTSMAPGSTTVSTSYTGSVYAATSGTRYLQLVCDDGSNGAFATFDLVNGVISGPIVAEGTGVAIGAAIQSIGGGIYRCSVSATFGTLVNGRVALCLSNVPSPAGIAPSYAGNTANSVLTWGGQLEQGAFPTSFITTGASATTRAADVATMASISGRNAAAESFAAEFALSANPARSPRIVADNASQRAPLLVNTTQAGATTDLVSTATTANVLTLGAVSKLAANWATPNAGRVCLNAGTVAGATTLTTGYSGITTMRLMGDSVAADTATGYMRRFRYWPRVLADAELQSVTT